MGNLQRAIEQKGIADGYAGLDAQAKVPSTQLPSYVDDVLEVANFASLPVTGEAGKIYITLDTNYTYRWSGSAYLDITGKVDSVAGKTGTVVLDKSDVGLNLVDNTSDSTKNSAVAILTNKTLTSPVINAPTGIVKADVGLGSVDNTTDLGKPVSTATQTALDLKVDENVAITGATKTKITYDAKGLVTGGADLAAADIPTLTAAEISDFDTEVANNSAVAANTAKLDATYTAAQLQGAIGNINNPLLDLPLNNSLSMKQGAGSVTFTRASGATYIDRYGVLKTAATDEARFEKEGLLIEGASTNKVLYSEQYDNVIWGKFRSSISPNTSETTDLYGTNLADKLTEDTTAAATHYTRQSISYTAGTTYTQSVFVKPNGRSWIRLLNQGGGLDYGGVYFDIENGTVGSIFGPYTAKIEKHLNGWCRCSITTTAVTSDASNFETYICTANNIIQHDGDGTSGIYVFGAQVEALPFATSYIPTTTAAVTRSADNCEVQFIGNFNNIINSIITDVSLLGKISGNYQCVYRTDSANIVRTNITPNEWQVYGGNAYYAGQLEFNKKIRIAVTNENGSNFYLNGVFSASGDVNQMGTTTGSIYIGSRGNGNEYLYGHIRNFRTFDKALTAQEIALA